MHTPWWKTIPTWVLILVFISGGLLLFTSLTQSPAIDNLGKKEIDDMTADKIAKAAKAERRQRPYSNDFAYDKTGQLSPLTVTGYRAREALHRGAPYYPAGQLMIPAVDLNLPIGIGVSNSVLVRGAGTLKPDQQMGEGNYALAGHYMTNERILFSPIKRVKRGDRIILTDLKKVYTYRATRNYITDKDDVDVLSDRPGDRIVTLITCASWHWNEPNRIVVQGRLQGARYR